MNEVSNKNLGFSPADTPSITVNPSVDTNGNVNSAVTDNNNNVPTVPLNSYQPQAGNEEYWLASYIADKLFIEMCERGPIVDDPGILSKKTNGDKINYYYLQAAKYALRISAGNFDGANAKYKPVFEIHYNDFTDGLQAQLKSLFKDSPDTLKTVVQDAVFSILKARHKMIFYQYIENDGLKWRFVAD